MLPIRNLTKGSALLALVCNALAVNPERKEKSYFLVLREVPKHLARFVEACLSCGRRFTQTGATITIRAVCGHKTVCKICPECSRGRGLV